MTLIAQILLPNLCWCKEKELPCSGRLLLIQESQLGLHEKLSDSCAMRVCLRNWTGDSLICAYLLLQVIQFPLGCRHLCRRVLASVSLKTGRKICPYITHFYEVIDLHSFPAQPCGLCSSVPFCPFAKYRYVEEVIASIRPRLSVGMSWGG